MTVCRLHLAVAPALLASLLVACSPVGEPYEGPLGPSAIRKTGGDLRENETWLLDYDLSADGRPYSVDVRRSNGLGDSSSYTIQFAYGDDADAPCSPPPPVLGISFIGSLMHLGIAACPESIVVNGAPAQLEYDGGRLVSVHEDFGAYGSHDVDIDYAGGAVAGLHMTDSFGTAHFQYDVSGDSIGIDAQYDPAEPPAVASTWTGTAELGPDGRRLRERGSVNGTSFTVSYEYEDEGP